MFVPGMPRYPDIYANDLIDVLKKKHASGTYKSLVSDSLTVFCGMKLNASLREIKNLGPYCRYFILKLASLGVFLRACFQKVWIYMQPQHLMQKRVAGEPTALDSIPVLLKNTKPVWVTCIVLPGWRTGTQQISDFLIISLEFILGSVRILGFQILHLDTFFLKIF